MDAGKLGPQTAHASHMALLGDVRPGAGHAPEDELTFKLSGAAAQWLQGDFPKMALEVYSESELLAIFESAKAAGLPCSLVQDNGWTVFKGKPYTVVGVGPAAADEVNAITGHLKKYDSKTEMPQ